MKPQKRRKKDLEDRFRVNALPSGLVEKAERYLPEEVEHRTESAKKNKRGGGRGWELR